MATRRKGDVNRLSTKYMMTHKAEPFVYYIAWTAHDRHYIGSRWTAGCSPADMWNTYYTSSRPLQEFAMTHGKPDVIDVLYSNPCEKKVRAKERQLIAEHKAITDTRYFNKAGGNLTVADVKAIRAFRNVKSAVDLAADYGVTRTSIYNIWNEKNHSEKGE